MPCACWLAGVAWQCLSLRPLIASSLPPPPMCCMACCGYQSASWSAELLTAQALASNDEGDVRSLIVEARTALNDVVELDNTLHSGNTFESSAASSSVEVRFVCVCACLSANA